MVDNTTPSDPKIIPINRPRLVTGGGTPIQGVPPPKPIDPDEPQSFEYQIVLRDGNTILETGFLIATPTFIGIGMGGGQLELVVPMEQLAFARRLTPANAA